MDLSLTRRSGRNFQMPGDVPLSIAPVIGVSIVPILYLPYTYLFIRLCRVRRSQRSGDRFMTFGLSLLYVLTTLAFILNIQDVVDAWAFHSDNPLKYFLRPNNQVIVAQTLSMLFTNINAICILIWRLYVVWSRNKLVVILPILMVMADTGVVIAVCVYQSQLFLQPLKFFKISFDLMTAYFTLTITQYVVVTSLIIGKLLWKQRKMTHKEHASYRIGRQLIGMSLESGFVSLLTVAIYGIFWYKGLLGWLYIAQSLEPTIISFIPTLIVYRLHLVVADTSDKPITQIPLHKVQELSYQNSVNALGSPYRFQQSATQWAGYNAQSGFDLSAALETARHNAFENSKGQYYGTLNAPPSTVGAWSAEWLNSKPLPPPPVSRPSEPGNRTTALYPTSSYE